MQHAPSPHVDDTLTTPATGLSAAVPGSLGAGFAEPGEPVTVLRTPTALSVEQILAALWLADPEAFDPEGGLSPAELAPGAFRVYVDSAVTYVGLMQADTAAGGREANPPAPGSRAEAWEAAARRAVGAMLAAEAAA